MAGLPFLEREVERSTPRVVCFQGLGIVAPVHVTTILSLFNKIELFSLYRYYICTQKIYQIKIPPPPPPLTGEGIKGDIFC